MPCLPDRRSGPELLDLSPESYTFEEHEGSLRELRLVNRYLGDVRAILKHLATIAAARGRDRLTVLDVGTGSADIPAAIDGWARKRGMNVFITAVDVNPFERQGRLLRSRSISGLFSRSLYSGLQPPCLRFAVAVTGHRARLGTRLLARLYRGRHLRRQSSTHLHGATLVKPDVPN